MPNLIDNTPIANAVNSDRSERVAFSWLATPTGTPKDLPISINKTPATNVAPLEAYRESPSAYTVTLDRPTGMLSEDFTIITLKIIKK